MADESEPRLGRQREGLALLVALVWILGTALVRSLSDASHWYEAPLAKAFLIALCYMALIPFLKSRHCVDGGHCASPPKALS
jgi:hypothetical protein